MHLQDNLFAIPALLLKFFGNWRRLAQLQKISIQPVSGRKSAFKWFKPRFLGFFISMEMLKNEFFLIIL